MRSHLHPRRTLALSLVGLALAVPSATARPIDPPLGVTPNQEQQGIASRGVGAPDGDLRSPDARVAAPPIAYTRGTTPVHVAPGGARTQVAEAGFDWGDAGVGAALSLALGFFALSTFMVVQRHRGPARRHSATIG